MGNHRFTKEQRILSKKDYQKVFDSLDYRCGNRNFLLLARKSSLNTARIGLIVPKKHLKRAVDRNLIKRLARTTFRFKQNELVGLDIIVLLKGKPFPSKTRKQVADELDTLWSQISARYKAVNAD